MENLELYEAMRQVPQNAQKPILGGKLKGKTDINPLWRIKTLTQQFGPVGFGWNTQILEHWVEQQGDQACMMVRIALRVCWNGQWSQPIEGVGGSMLIGKGTGADLNDEALKMAYTDAISVACKSLGMAADIYWVADGTKYDVQPPQEVQPQPQQRAQAQPVQPPLPDPTQPLSPQLQLDLDAYLREISELSTVEMAKAWWRNASRDIPAEIKQRIYNACISRCQELTGSYNQEGRR